MVKERMNGDGQIGWVGRDGGMQEQSVVRPKRLARQHAQFALLSLAKGVAAKGIGGDMLTIFYVCSNSGILTCYQAKTGELVYKKRLPMKGNRSFVGSPVAADGHLYLTSEEGETAVIAAGPTFELVGNNSCGENCLTTPAISRGTFYLRGQRHVFAFRQAGQESVGDAVEKF